MNDTIEKKIRKSIEQDTFLGLELAIGKLPALQAHTKFCALYDKKYGKCIDNSHTLETQTTYLVRRQKVWNKYALLYVRDYERKYE